MQVTRRSSGNCQRIERAGGVLVRLTSPDHRGRALILPNIARDRCRGWTCDPTDSDARCTKRLGADQILRCQPLAKRTSQALTACKVHQVGSGKVTMAQRAVANRENVVYHVRDSLLHNRAYRPVKGGSVPYAGSKAPIQRHRR